MGRNGQRMGLRPCAGRQMPYDDIGMTGAGAVGATYMSGQASPMMMSGNVSPMMMSGNVSPMVMSGRNSVRCNGAMLGPYGIGGQVTGLVKGPLPVAGVQMVQQPRMMMVQQPRMMMMQQQPQIQVIPRGSDNTRQFMEGNTRVIERTVVTPQTQVMRTVITPKKTVVGYRTVPTVQNVVTQNPSTMKMTTEYAEPYIKRAGYTQRAGFTGQTTKIVSKGDVVELGNTNVQTMAMPMTTQVTRMTTVAAPAMTNMVTRMQTTVVPTGNELLGRGYTRIDPWKHCGDDKRRR